MNTNDLIQNAQDKRFSDFDQRTKDILKQRVAEKLHEKGYFDRLAVAKGETVTVTESEKSKEEQAHFRKVLKKYGVKDLKDVKPEDKKAFFADIKAFDNKED